MFETFIKRFFWRLVIRKMIIDEILKINPDVVHCNDLPTLPIGCLIKKRTNCELVYDSHEIFEHVSQLSKLYRLYYRSIQKKCSRHVDYFITINESIQKYLNQSYPKLPLGIVIKNATPYCQKLPDYDGRLHRAAGFEKEKRILLYQGGFSRHRGLEMLVRSAPLLKEGWGLIMMGSGDHRKRIEKSC